MSNNDLIRREDVVFLLDTFIAEFGKALIAELGDNEELMSARELASIVTDIVVDILATVKAIPAAPQEMSAIEFLKNKSRMKTEMGFPGIPDIEKMRDAVAFVEQWAREHPEVSE